MASYNQICITTPNRQKIAVTTTFHLQKWQVLLCSLLKAPSRVMIMMNSVFDPIQYKFILKYLYNVKIHSNILVEDKREQNVNQLGSHEQTTQILCATLAVLLTTSGCSQASIKLSTVLLDSARAFLRDPILDLQDSQIMG